MEEPDNKALWECMVMGGMFFGIFVVVWIIFHF